MPIEVQHQPSASVIGNAANTIGQIDWWERRRKENIRLDELRRQQRQQEQQIAAGIWETQVNAAMQQRQQQQTAQLEQYRQQQANMRQQHQYQQQRAVQQDQYVMENAKSVFDELSQRNPSASAKKQYDDLLNHYSGVLGAEGNTFRPQEVQAELARWTSQAQKFITTAGWEKQWDKEEHFNNSIVYRNQYGQPIEMDDKGVPQPKPGEVPIPYSVQEGETPQIVRGFQMPEAEKSNAWEKQKFRMETIKDMAGMIDSDDPWGDAALRYNELFDTAQTTATGLDLNSSLILRKKYNEARKAMPFLKPWEQIDESEQADFAQELFTQGLLEKEVNDRIQQQQQGGGEGGQQQPQQQDNLSSVAGAQASMPMMQQPDPGMSMVGRLSGYAMAGPGGPMMAARDAGKGIADYFLGNNQQQQQQAPTPGQQLGQKIEQTQQAEPTRNFSKRPLEVAAPVVQAARAAGDEKYATALEFQAYVRMAQESGVPLTPEEEEMAKATQGYIKQRANDRKRGQVAFEENASSRAMGASAEIAFQSNYPGGPQAGSYVYKRIVVPLADAVVRNFTGGSSGLLDDNLAVEEKIIAEMRKIAGDPQYAWNTLSAEEQEAIRQQVRREVMESKSRLTAGT